HVPLCNDWYLVVWCSVSWFLERVFPEFYPFPDRSAFPGILPVCRGQIAARCKPDVNACHVPPRVPAFRFHLSHRPNARRDSIDHVPDAGPLLYVHHPQCFSEGIGDHPIVAGTLWPLGVCLSS